MTTWLRRLRGAVGMGVTWAAAWAVAGVLIGVTSVIGSSLPWGKFFDVFDAPAASARDPRLRRRCDLRFRARRRGATASLRGAVCAEARRVGALGGLLLSLVPVIAVAVGLLDPTGAKHDLWYTTAVISGPFIILSALSAAGSLMVARARRGERAGQPEYRA